MSAPDPECIAKGSNPAEAPSFSQRWRDKSRHRHVPDDAAVWDSRVKELPDNYAPSSYSHDFLALANIASRDSVFDMGAGAGSLAIPCARAGHQVLACDFSPSMLKQLERNRRSNGVPAEFVRTMLLSWEDDWEEAGIAPKSFDVAFASRSLITHDLEDSLRKLTNVARKKVCVTVVDGVSPRCFPGLLRDLGLTPDGHDDASFVCAIARELGLDPVASPIESRRTDVFSSAEEAFAKYEPMLALTREKPCGAQLEEARKKLHAWLDAHLIPHAPTGATSTGQAEAQTLWTPDVDRTISWAFVSWIAPDHLV